MSMNDDVPIVVNLPITQPIQNIELPFLQYAYTCLNYYTRIAVQKNYTGTIPPEYYITLCSMCDVNPSVYSCEMCTGKSYCSFCVKLCKTRQIFFCLSHFLACPKCKQNCVCTGCRIYHTDNICSVCSDTDNLPFSCGCVVRGNSCTECRKKMDPITRERRG